MASVSIQIEHDGAEPIRDQIARAYATAIRDGKLPAGSKLPSVRALAARLGVSPATVVAAYRSLQDDGLASSTERSGFCVAGPGAGSRSPQFSLPMHRIEPDLRIAPVEEFMKILSGLSVLDRGLCGYEDYRGNRALRDAIAEFDRAQSIPCEPESGMLITSGAQQALTILARALGTGARVAFENPCYVGARIAFANAGAEIQPLASDAAGKPAFGAVSRPGAVDALYCCPTYGNPRGFSWDVEERLRLLDAARKGGFLIIEDDFLGDLDYLGERLPRLAELAADFPGVRVSRIRTFSKSLFPALRLAGLCGDPSVIERALAQKTSDDIGSSAILQRGLSEFIANGRYAAYLERVRPRYRATREALRRSLSAIAETSRSSGFSFEDPPAGLCLIGKIPSDVDRSRFIAECATENAFVTSGPEYWAGGSGDNQTIRVGFGPLSPEEASLVGPVFLSAAARARELSPDHSFL